LLASDERLRDVAVTVESSTTRRTNDGPVETCRWYCVVPDNACHARTGDVDWFIALFEGERSVGPVVEAGCVVKLQTADQLLVPPAFDAFTLQ
jgi:hypothetical protein